MRSRGVVTNSDGVCPFVRAEVALLGSEVLTSIEDGDGRACERVLASPQVAATLIESWTRSDLSADLLGPPAPMPSDRRGPPAATAAPPPAPGLILGEDAVVASEPRAPWGAWLLLAGEATAGTNRTTAFGFRAAACGRVGRACLGGLVRFGYDPGLTGNSESLETERLALDGLLLADFPLEWSRVALTPGLGIGGGWTRSSRLIVDSDDGDEVEQTGENEDRNEIEGQVAEDEGGLRVDVHLTLSLALVDALTLDATVSAGLSAFGHYGSYNYDDGHIAGEPRGTFRGGVGLGYRF